LLVKDLLVEVSKHVQVVRCSQSGDRIPSYSAVVPLARWRASVFGTQVVSLGDVLEALRAFSGHLVQQWVKESKRLLGFLDDTVVEEGNDTGEDRGSARCSTNRFDLSTIDDQNLRSETSDVRESTSGRVVVRGRWELNSRVQVFVNGSCLVRWLGSNERESTSRSVVGLSERDGFFVTARSAALSRTSRRRVREVSNSRRLVNLCSTNRGDERRGSRERRVQVVFRAVRVGTSVSSRVTRGGDEGNSTESNLLELNVDFGDVSLGVNSELLAFLSTNSVFALIFFVPSIGNGVNKRNVGGSEHVNTESVEPNVVGFNPEPSLSVDSDSESPLDVKVGFDLRVGWVVGSDDVVGGNSRNVNGELGGEGGKIVRGEVLVDEFDDTARRVTGNLNA